MGLMDILRGRNKNQPQEDEASARLDAFEGEALRSSEREQRRGRGEEEKEGAGGERRHMLFDEASATSVFGSEDSNDSGRVYNPYAGEEEADAETGREGRMGQKERTEGQRIREEESGRTEANVAKEERMRRSKGCSDQEIPKMRSNEDRGMCQKRKKASEEKIQ